MSTPLIERALHIAAAAHEGQYRKAKSRLPYIIHPVAMAFLLERHGFGDTVIAAALTHDVLEDTSYGEKNLKKELGSEVYEMVKTVSYDPRLKGREKILDYIDRVARGSEGAKAVAVADKIHNMESLLEDYRKEGPAVWKNFSMTKTEKVAFYEAFLKRVKAVWKHPLIAECESLLKKMASLSDA